MNSPKKNITPNRHGFWRNGYTTYRRLWIDSCLGVFAGEMNGVVIDLGGKRENKRGLFKPPEYQARAWWYINLDWVTAPSIFADVNRTPLQAGSADCILCTEVLEHLQDPQACVDEIYRLLRDDGLVFASTPFFYPVHADPYDYQRFTDDGLRQLFRNFRSVTIYRMGGYPGVLGLMLELGIPGMNDGTAISRFLQWAMKWISRWLCWYDILAFDKDATRWNKFTTGYFVKASR